VINQPAVVAPSRTINVAEVTKASIHQYVLTVFAMAKCGDQHRDVQGEDDGTAAASVGVTKPERYARIQDGISARAGA